jgi:hypothetical protein
MITNVINKSWVTKILKLNNQISSLMLAKTTQTENKK